MAELGLVVAAGALVFVVLIGGLVAVLVWRRGRSARAEVERDALEDGREAARAAEVHLDRPTPVGDELDLLARARRERRMRKAADRKH